MVIMAKKSGKPRRMVNLSPLNKHCLRETHSTETPFFQVSRMRKNTFKSVVVTWNGYQMVEWWKESCNLTAFITLYGCYRYCPAFQGHVCL